MNWLKKKWHVILLVILACGFFIVYQFLYLDFYTNPLPANLSAQEPAYLIFNQPDEMANYLFIRTWVLHNQIGLVEPLSSVALNQLHPRSMTVVNGELVPIGFPGFIVLMTIVLKLFHFFDNGILFNYLVIIITPLVAATAPLFFYGIIRRLFDDKTIAFVSASLLFVLPPWWYYASRPLQHMTLFVTLLLAAAYFLILNKARSQNWTFFLFSFFGSLALYVRPSEWLWTLVLFLSLIGFVKLKLNVRNIFLALIGFTLVVILFFATQTVFYGHPLASGYVRPHIDGTGGLLMSGSQGIPFFQAIFLPFGFHPMIILKTMYNYGFKLIAPWRVAAIIGLVVVLFERRIIWRNYFIICGIIGIPVILFYGSWNFADNLAGLVSIGSSQTRYFLPLYVFLLPFIAFLLKKLWSLSKASQLTAGIIVTVLLLFSIKAVFFSFEGLWEIKHTIAGYYNWQEKIYTNTPGSSIIVTRYGDKYIFPGRRVIVNWKGEDEIKAIRGLSALGFPLYWYDVQLNKKERIVLDKAWQVNGLNLAEPIIRLDNLELRPIMQVENFGQKK